MAEIVSVIALAHAATLASVKFLFGEVSTLAELKAMWGARG